MATAEKRNRHQAFAARLTRRARVIEIGAECYKYSPQNFSFRLLTRLF
jgi:hypothetical protein